MNFDFGEFWESIRHMVETLISRLPSLLLGIIVFVIFYVLSIVLSRVIRQATRGKRQNLGVVFARLVQAATIMLGLLVAVSFVAPSFQAGDLIKILGIGGVAIGFAFQNILQNFLAGLLLLWAEPFRIGDEIKIDVYEGTVEEIQTRATIIKTYDERRVVIPMQICLLIRSSSTPRPKFAGINAGPRPSRGTLESAWRSCRHRSFLRAKPSARLSGCP